jgi:O-antigen ligase
MESQVTSTVVRRAEDEGSFTFYLLCVLLFFLFFRPADLVPQLKVLHLPMLFAVLCLGSHIMSSASRGAPIFRLTPITKVLALFTFWVLLGVPFAYWQGGALSTLINDWSKMLLLFLIMANAILTVKQLRITIWICLLSATIVSFTAIINYLLHGTDAAAAGRLTALVNGPYAGANYFSVTLVLMLPFMMFDFFLHPKILVRIISFGCTSILAVANLMTQSRAGIVGMVVVGVGVLWNLRRWGVNVLRIVVIMVLLSPVVAILVPQGVWERFSTIFEDYDVQSLDPTSGLRMAAGSQKERLLLIVKAVTLTFEHPIFGVGMGDFSSASAHKWDTGSGRDWVATHNTYLQISSECGFPGFAIYLFLIYVTFKTLRVARDALPEGGPGTKPYMLRLICDAAKVSLIGYLLTSAFANVGYQCYFFLVAGISQAFAVISLHVTANEPENVPRAAPAWPPEPEVKPV